MDFEQQKPITDEFRKGWERIYSQQEARKVASGTMSQIFFKVDHIDKETNTIWCTSPLPPEVKA
jgi:hypothetical protein